MAEARNAFADGRTYDRAMGRISRIAGAHFLDWLSPPAGLRWLDVGCGTGSFTGLILDRCAPADICAVDPAEDQIAIAKSKPGADRIDYRLGDAIALPLENDTFDVAILALVIQYIPDPAKAMAEIVRVVRPGGTVAAYVWPGYGGGHPFERLREAVRFLWGGQSGRPGGRMRTIEAVADRFAAAGLADVESNVIELTVAFADFEDCWSAQPLDEFRDLPDAEVARLKDAVRERHPADRAGRISYRARANAVRGRVVE